MSYILGRGSRTMTTWHRLTLRTAIWALLLAANANVAHGSMETAIPSWRERLTNSKLIIAGTIGRVTTKRNPTSGMVYSLYHINSIVSLGAKKLTSQVVVRAYGGSFEGNSYEIAGAASLLEGERYIFLLNRSRADSSVFELAYEKHGLLHVLGTGRLVFDYSWRPVLDVTDSDIVLGKPEKATRNTPAPHGAITKEVGGSVPPKDPIKSNALTEGRVLSAFQQLLDSRDPGR